MYKISAKTAKDETYLKFTVCYLDKIVQYVSKQNRLRYKFDEVVIRRLGVVLPDIARSSRT